MGSRANGYRIGIGGFRRKYLKALKREFSPSLVLAFGSRARGDNLKSSDLDLVIVSEVFAGMAFPQRAPEVMVKLEVMEAMDLLCYTPEEYEKKRKQIGIVRIATREGVVIYRSKEKEKLNERAGT